MQGSKTVKNMSKQRNKSIKTKYTAKMNKIVKKDKTTENERKSSKKVNEKRQTIVKEKTKIKKIDTTQLKTIVKIYHAAETGAMKLV